MIEHDNKTIWCGYLAEQVTEEILYELFLQAGPLERVRIAKNKDGSQKNFAFITYCHEVSVPYAINLFRGTTLFNRKLVTQCRGQMALLPPPIRCFGPDPNIDFSNQSAVVQKFADMTNNLNSGPGALWFDRPQPQHHDGRQMFEPPPMRDMRDVQKLQDAQQLRDMQHLREVHEVRQSHEQQLRDEQHQQRKSPSDTSRHRDRKLDSNDKLVMASLQGNWTHRHHPYRSKEQPQNRDYRSRDNQSRNREKSSGNWRDRRNHKSYHRRD